jgi:hypothetical protein
MTDVEWPPIEPSQIVGLLRSYCEDDRRAGNGFSAGVHAAAADEIERLRDLLALNGIADTA